MSTTLMKHARVLVVGVALIVMTLAMAPGVANAKTDDVGGKADAALKGGDSSRGGGSADKADGNRGGGGGAANLDGKVEGALKGNDGGKGDGRANDLQGKAEGALKGDARSNLLGDTNLNTDTNTDQRVDLNDPPLVGGDTKSINEVNSDLVPAKGEAKADADIVVDGLIDEGLCVRGALNQNASGCGGGAADGAGNGDGLTTAVPDININANEILGDTTVDSATNTDQRVDLNNPPLVDGDTTTINEVNSELIPAKGNADVDALAQVDGLLREEVCARNALNQDAGGCGSSGGTTGGAPNGNDNEGVDLGEPLTNLEETIVNSDTVVDQRVNDDPLQSVGNTTSNTDVDAPAAPASAKVEGEGIVEVPGLLNQEADVCGTLNAENCGGNSPAPGNSGNGGGSNDIDLGDTISNLEDINTDSDTSINENLDPTNPTLNGAVKNSNNFEVPLPISGTVKVDGNGAVGDVLEQTVNSCTDVNASGCGAGGNTAPAAPGSGGPGGIDLDDLLDLDDTTADSDTNIEENLDPNNTPVLDGTVDNTNNTVAEDIPASAKAELDANVNAPGLLEQDLSSCTTLNAGPCGASITAPPGSSGPGGGGSGDRGAGEGDSGDGGPGDSGTGDSGSSPGDDGPGGEGSGGELTDGNDGSGFGEGFPLLGRLLERAAAPADSTGSSDGSGSSSNSGSANNDRAEPASATNPLERGSQTLAANPSTTSSSRFVALSAGPSGDQDRASASSGSKTKSGELPDTGGITPLVLLAGLLFIGGGLLLTTKRRRFTS